MSRLDRVTHGVEYKPQRILVYGVEGIGKSGFAASFPAPLILAAENGVSHIDTSRIVPNDWEDALGILSELYYESPRTYQTIVVDTVKWMEQLAEQRVCEVNRVSSLEQIGFGKWKQMIIDTYLRLMQWLDALYRVGFNVILVAHAKIGQFKNPEGDDYDRYSIMMNRIELADELRQWCDVVAFMNFDTYMIDSSDTRKPKQASSSNRRLMHLTRTVAFDAKNRYLMSSRLDMGQTPAAGFAAYMREYQLWPERLQAMMAA